MSKKRTQHKNGHGRGYVGVLSIFLIIVMAIQIGSLYRKNAEYQKQEAALQEELEVQQAEAENLKVYEEYTQSDDYVENTAHGKLGLAHENEIIFRQNDD